MTKRGAVRSVFDGRYGFARYFSPKQHNRPTTGVDAGWEVTKETMAGA
jgi:hypothetical protein